MEIRNELFGLSLSFMSILRERDQVFMDVFFL